MIFIFRFDFELSVIFFSGRKLFLYFFKYIHFFISIFSLLVFLTVGTYQPIESKITHTAKFILFFDSTWGGVLPMYFSAVTMYFLMSLGFLNSNYFVSIFVTFDSYFWYQNKIHRNSYLVSVQFIFHISKPRIHTYPQILSAPLYIT